MMPHFSAVTILTPTRRTFRLAPTEYRKLTEDIADFCQQLLLSWTTPTGLRFNADPEKARKLLLEQFLFLKHFMTKERLDHLLEVIRRNPHSHLLNESGWLPAAAARSSKCLSDPSGMLRDWRITGRRRIPGEVLDVRKCETFDTAPNRFIKFALGQFRQICADVCSYQWTENKENSTLWIEAKEMLDQLDAFLARRFFNEVGLMRRLPLDNQTLQKRGGYREILQAWLLTQAATTLDWEGERGCFEGKTRDVATLYEYWIFIQLHQILDRIPGLEPASPSTFDAACFISESDGQITINLRQGKYSRSRFIWQGKHAALRINLQYERSFSSSGTATGSGSYTRKFRPDYTLSIYPASFDSEQAADLKGKVAHLHFDAKYRAEEIASIFGDTNVSDGEITIEKLESKSERIYKRGDLLKMHTYNDALRNTIGSYVLYPGTKTEEAEKWSKFHEIAPGVGALVMKPGNTECQESMSRFLLDIFEHQADVFSQFRYLSDTNYQTHHGKPQVIEEAGVTYNIARKEAPCVILWLRKRDEAPFREPEGGTLCHTLAQEKG